MTGINTAASPRGSGARGGVRRGGIGRRAAITKAGIAAVLAAGATSGCINIAAPDAPIVIELNINIRQEVIYRLAADAANTIDENEDIF